MTDNLEKRVKDIVLHETTTKAILELIKEEQIKVLKELTVKTISEPCGFPLDKTYIPEAIKMEFNQRIQLRIDELRNKE